MSREDSHDAAGPGRVMNATVDLPESLVEDFNERRQGLDLERRNDNEREHRSDSSRVSRSQQGLPGEKKPPSSKKTSERASLVQDYLDSTFLEEDNDERLVKIPENECFFPSPMITFLIDQPKLACTICDEKLSMAVMIHEIKDTNIAILPCGHVACHGCLKVWLQQTRKCHVCRAEMRHQDCGHTVKPALITYDNITCLPKTLPKGGKISGKCRKCEREARHDKAVKMLRLAARGITNARYNIKNLKIEGEHASMMTEVVEGLFHRVPDEYMDGLRERRW
ncbi:hypothetical protein F5Y05DRAFT_409225 [Hypoxylon sp. FL0543]|nr:hypothetical protein F5Y05DRAFT_409225 [Hypoxylon sp. FL0543]